MTPRHSRPIDENTGDQGGVVEGLFEPYARNNAVGDSYLLGAAPPRPREES